MDVVQTFPDEFLSDEEQTRDIHEIRQLLDDNQGADNEGATQC